MNIIYLLLFVAIVFIYSIVIARAAIDISYAVPSWWSGIGQIEKGLQSKKIPNHLWRICFRPSFDNRFLFFHRMDLVEILDILVEAELVQRKKKKDISLEEISSKIMDIAEKTGDNNDDMKHLREVACSLNSCGDQVTTIWYYRRTPQGIGKKRRLFFGVMSPAI